MLGSAGAQPAFLKTSRALVFSVLWYTVVIFMCNATAASGVCLGGFW